MDRLTEALQLGNPAAIRFVVHSGCTVINSHASNHGVAAHRE
jgi:hypothetical protein